MGAQAAELCTNRAYWENRVKDWKDFYKLSEDNIATVREDLTKDYHSLADRRHTEERVQLSEDLGESQDETSRKLHNHRKWEQ